MRFKGLDLNLLIALDALLTEKSVTAAARRLSVTQPAMSGALARLRAHFQDELLVQVGRRMVLTVLADCMGEPIRQLLLQIEATVGIRADFDPVSSERCFTIAVSDFVTEVVMTRVASAVAKTAPKVQLDIMAPRQGGEMIESGEVDLLIMAAPYISANHPAELLYREDHVVVGWNGNPALGSSMTSETFFALGHVVVRFGRNRSSTFAEAHMNQGFGTRKVELVAPSFTSIPKLVVGTNRIAVMHRRLGEASARMLPLKVLPLPFEFPTLDVMIQHNAVRSNDGGVQWLKSIIHDCARQSDSDWEQANPSRELAQQVA